MQSHEAISVRCLLLLSAIHGLLISLVSVALTGCDDSVAASQDVARTRVQRGEYLVKIAGCHDCHTPLKMGKNGPEPDLSRMLSGHPHDLKMPAPPELGEGPWVWLGGVTNTAFAGPWGVSFAFNLTPDQLTGIGSWTESIFMNAIRTGRHWGQSRPILPPMPWPAYRNMTDEDLKSIFAYLRTIPAIDNQVPAPQIAGE
ncbi:MAG: c-type cytochrome [Planctomycetota bacterium]